MNSYQRFKNKNVFQDMLTDLFEAVIAILSPIAANNSDLAIEFSMVRTSTSRSILMLLNKREVRTGNESINGAAGSIHKLAKECHYCGSISNFLTVTA